MDAEIKTAIIVESCVTCLYFVSTINNRGECRRYPPEPMPSVDYRRYPLVIVDDWCGEWTKK